jgi:hypothetical protein
MAVDKTRSPRRTGGHRHVLGLAVAAGLLTSFAFATSAQADPFGLDQPTNHVEGVGAIPDNRYHNYCFDGSAWNLQWRDRVDTAMENFDQQTIYRVFRFGSPTGTRVGDARCDPRRRMDVQFELSTTMAARGDYRCVRWNRGADGRADSGDERCTSATIRINSTARVLTTNHQRSKTICHEIGHSVGLAHGNPDSGFHDDCMVSGAVTAGLEWEQFNQHHVDHANSRTPSQT